ncbi:cytochrome P450 2K3-like [Labrus mixtus]|uniref:cytochrome P450 2K3-like n=1 Tax=Labrus mixtus TaxID=508554 RepID=UPI0029C03847|nr:cytochrome P450 2K3-like [Labrus mixtus]
MESLFLQSPGTTTVLCTVGVLLVFYVLFSSFNRQRKEPPGPWPLPVIGNWLLLDLGLTFYTFFIFLLWLLYQLSKKYGPVFTFHLGPKKVVVFAGHKMIKQALVHHDAFSETEVPQIIQDLKLTHGILFANGASWKEMRQFSLTKMKDFGMGKKACEEKIIEESQRLIDIFKEKNGKGFDPAQPVNNSVSNIICSIVYGNRFEYDDPIFTSMVERATQNSKLLGCPSMQVQYTVYMRAGVVNRLKSIEWAEYSR